MELTSKSHQVIKTCNLYALFFVLGMFSMTYGRTLNDLAHIFDMRDITYIYLALSKGLLIGSTTGGIVFDMMAKEQILFMVYSLMLSVTLLGVPWSKNITNLFVWITLQGISIGSLWTGGNIFCIQLWGKKNGPFYQALFFFHTVGSIFGQFLVSPMLGIYADIGINTNNTIRKNHEYIANDTISGFQNSNLILTPIPAVTYVYILLAVLFFIIAVLHCIMYIVDPKDKTIQKSKTTTNENRKFFTKYYLVLLLFLLIFSSNGNIASYNQFIVMHALKVHLQLSSITGYYMTSVFCAAFTISKLIAIFLSIKISSLALIITNLIIVLLGSIILLFFSTYEWVLWLSSVLLGAGLAPLIPTCITWIEKYITITYKVGAVFSFSLGVSAMTIPYAINSYIEEIPYIFVYTIALNSACVVAVVVILFALIKNLSNKYEIQEKVVNLFIIHKF